jgi:hypothetical protein
MLCRLLSSKLWWEAVEHPTSLWEVSRSNPWIVMFARAVSTWATLFVNRNTTMGADNMRPP